MASINIDGYEIGTGLKVVDDTLMVDAVDVAKKDEERPISSHGVALEVGNLEVLLATV